MKLIDIDTSRFLYDPKDLEFTRRILKIPEFSAYDTHLDKKKIFTYIVLMYDFNTPTRKEFPDYYLRKYQVAVMSGFKRDKNGRFEKEYQDAIVGEDEQVNKLVAAYIQQFAMPEYTQLIGYLSMQYKITNDIQGGKFDDKTPKTMEFISTKISEITRLLFGTGEYDEILDARKSLYAKAEDSRLNLNIESIVDRVSAGDTLKDFSPYDNGEFNLETMKFLGDGPPQE